MPYEKTKRPPLTETQVADLLMEGTADEHPGVVVAKRAQVFDAALRNPATYAAIIEQTPEAGAILQATQRICSKAKAARIAFILNFNLTAMV